MANERAVNRWLADSARSDGRAPTYFEHAGGYVHGLRASDVIDFPDITVTESVIDEDTLLRLDLMRERA